MAHEGATGEPSDRVFAHDAGNGRLQRFIDTAFSARSVNQAVRESARFLRAAFGPNALEARILLRSEGDLLRAAAADGDRVLQGRRRSARRREVLRTGRARAIALRRPPGLHLAMVPLRRGEETFGVAEIVLDRPFSSSDWSRLESLAAVAASAIRAAEDRNRRIERLSLKLALRRNQSPKVGLLWVEIESLRHNADHAAGLVIEGQAAAHKVGHTSQPALPKAMAQHHRASTFQIIWLEGTALSRLHTE